MVLINCIAMFDHKHQCHTFSYDRILHSLKLVLIIANVAANSKVKVVHDKKAIKFQSKKAIGGGRAKK